MPAPLLRPAPLLHTEIQPLLASIQSFALCHKQNLGNPLAPKLGKTRVSMSCLGAQNSGFSCCAPAPEIQGLRLVPKIWGFHVAPKICGFRQAPKFWASMSRKKFGASARCLEFGFSAWLLNFGVSTWHLNFGASMSHLKFGASTDA